MANPESGVSRIYSGDGEDELMIVFVAGRRTWAKRRSATHVLVQSATETGKTRFMLDKLCPFAAKQGRNVLYLGNRTALEGQTKNVI